MKKWLLPFFLAVPLAAQVSNPTIVPVTAPPSGVCTGGLPNRQFDGIQYSCQNVDSGTNKGTWAILPGQGSGGGDISGTVTATHLTMGTGVDTVGDSPATYASSLFTFPNNLTVQAHSAFGVGSAIDSNPFLPAGQGAVLNIEETNTSTSGETGMVFTITLDPTADSGGNSSFGIGGSVQSASGSTKNFLGDLISMYGAVNHQGSGSVPQLTSLNADTENLGGGSIAPPGETGGMYSVANFMDNASGHVYGPSTNASAGGMVAYQADMNNEDVADDVYLLKGINFSNAGTITNLYGLYAGFTNPVNSGTLHNEYGVYIPSVDLGDTLNYQLYSAGTAPTYFHSSTFQLDNITGHGTAGVVHSDSSGNLSQSLVVAADAPTLAVKPVSNAITTATGGSGTGTVTCVTAACTNLRGSYTVAGGTFATGNLLVLVWPTTTTAYVCTASVLNNATGASIGYHSVATATGINITSLAAATGLAVDIDYSCQP